MISKPSLIHYRPHQLLRLLSLISVAMTSCSINGIGVPLTVEQTELIGHNARIVQIRATGIHAYTAGALGIQVGLIERTVVYPVLARTADHCANVILGTPAVAAAIASSYGHPVYIDVRRAGGGVEFAPWGISGLLGIGRRRMVRVSSTESLTFSYDNRSAGRAARVCAAIHHDAGGISNGS